MSRSLGQLVGCFVSRTACVICWYVLSKCQSSCSQRSVVGSLKVRFRAVGGAVGHKPVGIACKCWGVIVTVEPSMSDGLPLARDFPVAVVSGVVFAVGVSSMLVSVEVIVG